MPQPAQATDVREIRKYPNRRFYDATDSRHVTLEEIRDLVAQGVDVRVVDSKTGDDITVRVLAQILLEHESPKLDAFTSELMHELIRSNEALVAEFVHTYFSRAFETFMQSRDVFDAMFRRTFGLGAHGQSAGGGEAAHLGDLLWPWAAAFGATQGERDDADASEDPVDGDKAETPSAQAGASQGLRDQLEFLRRQLEAIESKLPRD